MNFLKTKQNKTKLLFILPKKEIFSHEKIFSFFEGMDDFEIKYFEISSAKKIEVKDLCLSKRKAKAFDYLFNFLSPAYVSQQVLNIISKASINFHPAPEYYPGVGSSCYALYNGDQQFSVVAHHMLEQIDTGPIIAQSSFDISSVRSPQQLNSLAYEQCLVLLCKVINLIESGDIYLEKTINNWQRKPITRKEFDQFLKLGDIYLDDDQSKKLLSADHPQFKGAYFNVEGRRFYAEK